MCLDISRGVPMATTVNAIYLNSQLNSYADAVYMYRAAVVDWRSRLLWELAD